MDPLGQTDDVAFTLFDFIIFPVHGKGGKNWIEKEDEIRQTQSRQKRTNDYIKEGNIR